MSVLRNAQIQHRSIISMPRHGTYAHELELLAGMLRHAAASCSVDTTIRSTSSKRSRGNFNDSLFCDTHFVPVVMSHRACSLVRGRADADRQPFVERQHRRSAIASFVFHLYVFAQFHGRNSQ
jgi:hypothetical protein